MIGDWGWQVSDRGTGLGRGQGMAVTGDKGDRGHREWGVPQGDCGDNGGDGGHQGTPKGRRTMGEPRVASEDPKGDKDLWGTLRRGQGTWGTRGWHQQTLKGT